MTMRDFQELNINEHGKRVSRDGPSVAVILAFEQEFGVQIPQEYIRLMDHSNGGHPELNSIEPMGRSDIASRSIDHFYYLDDDREGAASLWSATKAWHSILGKNYLPFAVDGGGNPFVFDLTAMPHAIKACLHDEQFALVDMAKSFDQFIDALKLDPDMI